MIDYKALPDLKAQAEELKCGVAATVDALVQRLDRAEHIIATVAVNCQKSRDPVLLVQYLAAIDYNGWLDTGVYTEPDVAPIPSGKTEEADRATVIVSVGGGGAGNVPVAGGGGAPPGAYNFSIAPKEPT